MKKLILEVEFEYDDELSHAEDQVAKDWFYNDILMNPTEPLSVFSNDFGDEVGTIKIRKILEIEV